MSADRPDRQPVNLTVAIREQLARRRREQLDRLFRRDDDHVVDQGDDHDVDDQPPDAA